MPTSPTVAVLIVDDQEQVVAVLARILGAAGYHCRTAGSVAGALAAIDQEVPDLLLCDIDMPEVSGLSLLETVTAQRPEVGVLMVTALDDPDMAGIAMDGGALGYLTKPFERNDILIGVANALRQRQQAIDTAAMVDDLRRTVASRTMELQTSIAELERTVSTLNDSREAELRRMACAAEFRDPETASHLERMSRYAAMLARAAGLGPARAELLRMASPMHDIGKIGIPDAVLLKEGVFTAEDRKIMEDHTRLGYELLAGSGVELHELAATVALTHHEWVDGSGYPSHLVGDAIPVEGRIVAIADVYDALTSTRRYKPAFSSEEAEQMMRSESGRHFDADLLDLFFAQTGELDHIRRTWSEDACSPVG